MLWWDYSIIYLLPAIIVSVIAQSYISSMYSKYSKVKTKNGMTGTEAAYSVLSLNNIRNVSLRQIGGQLTDHYDPRSNTISLSEPDNTSIASVAVAAHEAGHAVQHESGYFFAKLRMSLVPVANFASSASWLLVIFGLIFNSPTLASIGVFIFLGVLAFQLVTLPVELNASSRAMESLSRTHNLSDEELKGARKVLTAAAFTYVAAVFTALMQFIRLLSISRRD